MTTGPTLTDAARAPRGDCRVDASTILLLLASVGLSTAGQLLLKRGMTQIGYVSGVGQLGDLLRSAVSTWQIVVGLAAFGASAVFWLMVLSRVPLSTAYPMVSLGYVLILAFSVLVLGERPSPAVWGGVALIMAGISLVGIGQR